MCGMTQKAFHDFLLLLHRDPVQASHEYEKLRRKLISLLSLEPLPGRGKPGR